VALFGLGNSLLGQSRYLQAEQTYRHLLSIQPENKAALNNLAETMVRQGLYQDALEIINRAIKIESGDQEIMEICLQTRAEILKLKSLQNK
jgi:tetratricopeptide (TPR) repeat protein